MSVNEHTGDKMKSKVSTEEYRNNYDLIFKKPALSVDAAYQRKAIDDGFLFDVAYLFPENKEYYANHPSRSYTKP